MMPARPFGPLRVNVPVIGQGTWNMERDPRSQVEEALERGIALGMTHVDTAELYGSGAVEELIAPVVQRHRESLFLVSKVLPGNASKKGTIAACEQSLRRLRTEVLDLYLLHWPGSHPLEETISAFEALVQQGKIRAYGVSNFDAEELEQAVRIAGRGKIACNQVLYHLNERYAEEALLPYCKEQRIALVAYSPLGSGDFPGSGSPGGKELSRIAKKHQATPQQVALAFLTRDPFIFAIPKASKVSHVEDNAKAAELRLDKDDLDALDRAFPLTHENSLPML